MTFRRDPKDIRQVMAVMAELELKVSEFYRECGDQWPQDKEFWSDLEKDEIAHSGILRKMADLFSASPERFEANRPYNTATISLAMAGVQSHLQKLKQGQIQAGNILFVARDLEQSLLETKPGEILKTADGEYGTLLREITSQTQTHKSRLQKRIEDLKKDPGPKV
jgi:hypothetical protein